jgi:quercetin dioxygenase-like cupin family protein
VKLTTRSESMQIRPQTEPDRFTGEAGFRLLHTLELGGGARDPKAAAEGRGEGTWNTYPGNVSMVRYEPGARSHWHSHSGGQLLYIVEGEGWVQSRGEDPLRVRPGDSVSFAAGEVHWHGAAPGQVFAHVTVTTGKPTWYEESAVPPE